MKQSDEELVQLIFQACAELSTRTGRSVSPDGHLVGSLGEIHAKNVLGLTLERASNAGYDAVDDQGRKVEIKTTTRSSISLSASGTKAERLIVVKLDASTGAAEIIYDGGAARIKRNKTNIQAVAREMGVSRSTLDRLMLGQSWPSFDLLTGMSRSVNYWEIWSDLSQARH